MRNWLIIFRSGKRTTVAAPCPFSAADLAEIMHPGETVVSVDIAQRRTARP